MVEGREPLWTARRNRPVVDGSPHRRREVLVTTLLDAEPDSRHRHPSRPSGRCSPPSRPAVTFITLIFTPWGLVIGLPLLFVALLGWTCPQGEDHREERMIEAEA